MAGNLNKALQQQSNAYEEVETFLSDLKMSKYLEPFLDNGVEDLETVLELDEKHLEQMGIALGHKLKILKRIKDIRKEKGMEVPDSRQGKRKDLASDSQPGIVKQNNLMTDAEGDMSKSMKRTKRVAFADELAITGGVGTSNEEHKPVTSNNNNNNPSPAK